MKIFLYIFSTALIALLIIILYNTLTFTSRQAKVPAVKKISIKSTVEKRLSSSIQKPTISYDDKSQFDSSAFQGVIDLMQKEFPLCNSSLKKTFINKYSQVYEWKGSDSSLKPALLLAHIDVVPVEDGWEVPPFSGEIKNGFIWGRGSLDDKVSVFGIMEATEKLLKENFQPKRTIYLCFGHDEEVSGRNGAAEIAKWLKENKIIPEFVLDEGLIITEGIVPGIEKPVALIGVAEKGYIALKLSTNIDGGHSSMPHSESAIGVLSQSIYKIQQKPFDAEVSEPIKKFWQYIGPEMSFFKKLLFANAWLFKPLIIKAYEKTPSGNGSIRTTVAPTIFKSGIKENLIPQYAEAIVNLRTLPGHSDQEIISELKNIIQDDRVTIEIINSIPSSPISSTESMAYKLIDQSIREVFPDVLVAPSIMIAGTDSKHYASFAENTYRFLPVRFTKRDLERIHGKDEKISIEAYHDVIRFYYSLIQKI